MDFDFLYKGKKGEMKLENEEIERRFEIDNVPEMLDIQEMMIIEQTYLAVGEEQVRIRRTFNRRSDILCELTIKRGEGLIREEISEEIGSGTYKQLLSISLGKPVTKTRLVVKIDGNIVEIDKFFDKNLIIAEIEFPNKFQAEAYIPPSWFGKEVTKKSEYSNMNLWKSINEEWRNEN